MKLNLLSKIIFAVLLAFTVNTFIYFSFGNIYSSKILNFKDFHEQFHSGIYQYRILSGYLLIWIYELLTNLNIDYEIFKLKFLNTDSEPQMYLSFYILNSIFLILSALMMVLITESKDFVATNSEKLLMIAVAIFSISLSQFVIVPYDISSYFFLLLFFYVLIQYLKTFSKSTLIVLVLLMVISTFNRESSALSLSLAATLLLAKFGFNRKTIIPIAILTASFLAVYAGLRVTSQQFSTNDGNLLLQNFTNPKNLLGLLFWLLLFLFTLILAKDRAAINNILLFHLFSIPYLILCFYTGIIYEIRLYIPIFLTAILLSRIRFSTIH